MSPLNTSGGDDIAGGSASVFDEIIGTALRNCVRYCLFSEEKYTFFI